MLSLNDISDCEKVRTMEFKISNLCDRPEFFDAVADRMWRAWWQPKRHSLSQVSAGLTNMLKDGNPFPFGLVAHKDELFLGSTLGIASDLEERPDYTPWVAAIWAEPEHRGKKIGRTLVTCAAEACFARGFRRTYLCSAPRLRNFYVRQGWLPIEEGVGERALTVYIRDAK